VTDNTEIKVIDAQPASIQKTETTELAIDAKAPPMVQIAQMIASGINIDVDQMAKLQEISERYEANEARKAYHVAMSAFKEDPPVISKDRNVNYTTSKGTTNYNHATLGNVTAIINKALSKHGLTASWVTSQADKGIMVTCKVTHEMGHLEETSLTSLPDASGGKNPIQAIGSAVSYLQRYTILALTGLATHDMDDDGAGAGKAIDDIPLPTEDNWKCIDAIIKELRSDIPIDRERLAKWFLADRGRYPQDAERVVSAAEHVKIKSPDNIYAE